MGSVKGIEVGRADWPAWDAAVAAFQRSLRGHLQSIQRSTPESDEGPAGGDAGPALRSIGR